MLTGVYLVWGGWSIVGQRRDHRNEGECGEAEGVPEASDKITGESPRVF